MSYIDAKWEEPSLRTPAQTGSPSRRTGLVARITRWVEAMQTRRNHGREATELARMSDRELLDIGISRSDLDRVFDPEFNRDLRHRGHAV